jgi:deoxyribose-phosphate aldolase
MDDLKLLRKYLPEEIGIKAAGGLRTVDDVLEVYAAGCSRIGTTSTAAILDEWKGRIETVATAS